MDPRERTWGAWTSGLVVCLLVPCDCERVTVDEAELSVDDVESVDPDLVAIDFLGLAVTFPLDFIDCWRKVIRKSKLIEAAFANKQTYKTNDTHKMHQPSRFGINAKASSKVSRQIWGFTCNGESSIFAAWFHSVTDALDLNDCKYVTISFGGNRFYLWKKNGQLLLHWTMFYILQNCSSTNARRSSGIHVWSGLLLKFVISKFWQMHITNTQGYPIRRWPRSWEIISRTIKYVESCLTD